VKLPGNSSQSGYWAATWLMGNLGRAGYYPSLEGMWPFSYDDCANGDQAFDWNDNKTQRISRCRGIKGRLALQLPACYYLNHRQVGSSGKQVFCYVCTTSYMPALAVLDTIACIVAGPFEA